MSEFRWRWRDELASSDPNNAGQASTGAVWAMAGYHWFRTKGARGGGWVSSPVECSAWASWYIVQSRWTQATARELMLDRIRWLPRRAHSANGSRIPSRVARAHLCGCGSEAVYQCRSESPFRSWW